MSAVLSWHRQADDLREQVRELQAQVAELKAENERLRQEATDLLDAVYQTVMPEEGDRIVREAFCYSEPAWVEAWMREHPTEAEAEARAGLGRGQG
jgi:regulator of replication initiation timing